MGDFSYSVTQVSPQRPEMLTSSGDIVSAMTNGQSSPSGGHQQQQPPYNTVSHHYHEQADIRASPKRRVSNASMALRTVHLGPDYTPQELAGTDPAHRTGIIHESPDLSSQSRGAYRPFYPPTAMVNASSNSAYNATGERMGDDGQHLDWHAQKPPQSSSGQVPIWSYSVNHHNRNASGGTIHPQAIHLSNTAHLAPHGVPTNGLSTYPSYNTSNTRPMTAPSSSVLPQTNYYHASHTGGMFPPSAYSFAGFPHVLSGRHIIPAALSAAANAPIALLGDGLGPTTYLEGGKLISGPRPYSSSNFPERPGAGALAQQAQHRPPGSSGGPNDDFYGPAPPGSSGGMFSHYPPSAASNAVDAISGQFVHTLPAPPTSSHGPSGDFGTGVMNSASHPVAQAVSIDTLIRKNSAGYPLTAEEGLRVNNFMRASMELARGPPGSSHGSRPNTAAILRHDTAVTTSSTGAPAYSVIDGVVSDVALLQGVQANSGPPISSHEAGTSVRANVSAAEADSAAQQYDFVPLPSHPKKRPRRRFEEIERIYDCSYPGCPKAYGTLNHLNAHVSMQKHGPKRLPAEFKEIRKAWRLRQKAKQAARDAARKAGKNVDDDNNEEDDGDMDEDEEDHPSAEAEDSGNVRISPIKPVTPPAQRDVSLPNAAANFTNGSVDSNGSLTSMFDYIPPFLQPSYSPTHYTRPSTAPTYINHYTLDTMSNSLGLAGPNLGLNGIGQYGQVYVVPGQRKTSLTSIQPAFASIQEEEDTSQVHGIHSLDVPADEFAKTAYGQLTYSSPKTPEGVNKYMSVNVPEVARSAGNDLLSANAAPTPSYPGGVMSFAPFLNSPSDISSARPSTAPSPFRFTASAFTATAGLDSLSSAYDMLDKAGSFNATPLDDSQEESSRSWSPEWRALTQRSALKHEVH